ncbi:g6697 [Coccomyxa elongata]
MVDESKSTFTGAAGYDPNRLSQLEENVSSQVKSGAYDMDANLALFRHYNFAPEKANIQAMATVLIKAQMQLPNHDFAQLLHLIPERLQEEQPVAALIALTQHLEGARFQAYWQAADSCKDILASVPGYYDAIRAYILLAISSTCQKFGKQLLGDSLMLDGAALEKLIQGHKDWTESKAQNGREIVIFPKIEQSSSRSQGATPGGMKVDVAQLGLLLQTVH